MLPLLVAIESLARVPQRAAALLAAGLLPRLSGLLPERATRLRRYDEKGQHCAQHQGRTPPRPSCPPPPLPAGEYRYRRLNAMLCGSDEVGCGGTVVVWWRLVVMVWKCGVWGTHGC